MIHNKFIYGVVNKIEEINFSFFFWLKYCQKSDTQEIFLVLKIKNSIPNKGEGKRRELDNRIKNLINIPIS